MPKERKLLGHFVDSNFVKLTSDDGTPPTGTSYVRIGKHLEQFSEELSPQVNTFNNILGEQISIHTGYQVSSSVEPYYCEEGDPLWTKLEDIVNNRKIGSACETTVLDVVFNEDLSVDKAFMESALIVPTSYGGDTNGIQIPFTINYNGNRHRVNFNAATKQVTKYTA